MTSPLDITCYDAVCKQCGCIGKGLGTREEATQSLSEHDEDHDTFVVNIPRFMNKARQYGVKS